MHHRKVKCFFIDSWIVGNTNRCACAILKFLSSRDLRNVPDVVIASMKVTEQRKVIMMMMMMMMMT